MSGHEDATIARKVGVTKSTIGTYRRGGLPAPITLFRLAEALDVSPRWLATGEGGQHGASSVSAEDWVTLPRYDLMDFGEYGKPEPAEDVVIRRDWLGRARTVSGLWVTEMLSDAIPELAREGDLLICQDPTSPLMDGKFYVFLLSGRPLIRRISAGRDSILLRPGEGEEPIVIGGDQTDDLITIGRVVAAVAARQV